MALKLLLCVLFIFILFNPVTSATDWQDICSITVHHSYNTNCGKYSISQIQFSSPEKAHKDFSGNLVLDYPIYGAVIFKINNIEEPIYLSSANPFYINAEDNFKVSLSEITDPNSLLWEYSQYAPSARLVISHRIEPTLSITIMPESPEYYYSDVQSIRWYINITNTGQVDINNIDVTYTNGTNIFIPTLPATSNNKYAHSFSVDHGNPGKYKISTTATFFMRIGKQDIKYTFADIGTLTIKPIPASPPGVMFTKFIRSRIYTENNTVVLSISNSGEYELHNIKISDQFIDTGIVHYFNIPKIKPYTSENIQYKIRPANPGHFISPPAIVSYDIRGVQYSHISNSIPFDIIQKGIVLTVTPDEIGYIKPIATNISDNMTIDLIPSILILPFEGENMIADRVYSNLYLMLKCCDFSYY